MENQEAQPEQLIENESEKEPKQSGGSGLKILILFIILLLLAGTGAGGYFVYGYWQTLQTTLGHYQSALNQTNRQQGELQAQLALAVQQFDLQKQKIEQQTQALAEQRQRFEAGQSAIDQQKDQLSHSLQELRSRLGDDQLHWRLAEAEYLMRLAQQRLTLMADPATAQQALQAADESLAAVDTGEWQEVRQMLSQEIAALAATPKVDRDALQQRLDRVLVQAEALPLRDSSSTAEAATSPESAIAGEGGMLDDLWQGFKSLLVIRHHTQSAEALLAPEQGYFLRQNLSLQLQSAKLALALGNQPLFQDNLRTSCDWIERYYATDDTKAQQLLTELAELQDQTVAAVSPDISASLQALKAQRQRLSQQEAKP